MERGEFELPVPISEQPDDNMMWESLAPGRSVVHLEPPQTRGISSISPEILRNRELVDGERSIRTLRRPSMESCPAQFHHVFSCPY